MIGAGIYPWEREKTLRIQKITFMALQLCWTGLGLCTAASGQEILSLFITASLMRWDEDQLRESQRILLSDIETLLGGSKHEAKGI